MIICLAVSACSTDRKKSFELDQMYMKKDDLIHPMQDFEVTTEGLKIFREFDDTAMGESIVALSVWNKDTLYKFEWHYTVPFNGKKTKSYFDFKDVIRIVKAIDHKDSIFDYGDPFFEKIKDCYVREITNQNSFRLTFSFNLPTFCEESPLWNREIGFTSYLSQTIVKIDNKITQNQISVLPYILLNDIVFCDLKNRGIITKDTRFIVKSKQPEAAVHVLKLEDHEMSDIAKCNLW